MTDKPAAKAHPREEFPEVAAAIAPPGELPPWRERDLPEPVSVWQMIGPSIILAGLALGSGEFVIWPYITFRSGFVFFWAALAGVATQYVINMEIVRYTLATGESALTGFVRLSRHWAWLFLLMNTLPYIIPAWAKGAAQLLSWLLWSPEVLESGKLFTHHESALTLATLVACGVILSAGPVLYETVERVQFALVTGIIGIVIVLAVWLAWGRWDAVVEQVVSIGTLGRGQFVPTNFDGQDFTPQLLLGALAFAGAGGTLNLTQSNYIKDKGYGMGAYIGRITSPVTGNEEPMTELGYLFPLTEENLARWRVWWWNAGCEHFVSFFLTCCVTLSLLALIAYVLTFDAAGNRVADVAAYRDNLSFLWHEATELGVRLGPWATFGFLAMGVAILFSTEFGVLDATSRVSTDLVKVTWLRDDEHWSESRLYYLFLWGTIVAASIITLSVNDSTAGSLGLFKMTSSLNGAVMCVYSSILIYLNCRVLPPAIRMSHWRLAVMLLAVLFYGGFTLWTAWDLGSRLLQK